MFVTKQADSANNQSNAPDGKVSTVEVDPEIAVLLEKLQVEYGAHSKGRVIEMLLRDLMAPEGEGYFFTPEQSCLASQAAAELPLAIGPALVFFLH